MNRHQLLVTTAVLLSVAGTLSVPLDGAQTGWVHVNRRGPTNVNYVNLNTAPIDELTALSGITEAEAKKIIEGRPYKATGELVRRKILTADSYSRIRDRITVVTPPTRSTTPAR